MKRVNLLLLLLAVCCVFCGCSSFSKHKATNTEELRTEKFLDKPEQIIHFAYGKETALSTDALDATYSAFTEMMGTLRNVSTLKTAFRASSVKEWKKDCTCFEFRYAQRRNYVGQLDDGSLFTWGNLRFDAVLLVYYSGAIIAVPYIDGAYVGVNDLYLCLFFPETEINKFLSAV